MGAFSNYALIPEQGVLPEMEQLPEEMRETIRKTAARLRVVDSSAIAAFGARAQKEMGAFSEIALRQMMSEDIKPLDGLMKSMADEIRSCSFKAQAKSFLRRVTGSTASLAEVKAAYEKAEPRINACANDMTDRRVALMRDSALLDRLYDRNESLYRELCSLLVIGREAQRQAKEANLPEADQARLDRRLQDLLVTKTASTQMAAQIRLVQENDRLTGERLQTALEVTIPLWKAQMATALGLARATDSLRQAKSISRHAERGIRTGAKEVENQLGAYTREAIGDDRAQAEATAERLLSELDEIERSLKEQETLRSSIGA